MKILVLNGSPKREKSGTMRITRAFPAEMQAAASRKKRVIGVIDRRAGHRHDPHEALTPDHTRDAARLSGRPDAPAPPRRKDRSLTG